MTKGNTYFALGTSQPNPMFISAMCFRDLKRKNENMTRNIKLYMLLRLVFAN